MMVNVMVREPIRRSVADDVVSGYRPRAPSAERTAEHSSRPHDDRSPRLSWGDGQCCSTGVKDVVQRRCGLRNVPALYLIGYT